MKRWTALFAFLGGLLAAAVAGAGQDVDITYAGGLLTIRCAGADLADVLEQVGSATGMTLALDHGVKGTLLAAEIEAQPEQVALEQLLEGLGLTYAMSLSPDGKKVARIYVGKDTEAKTAARTATSVGRPPAAGPANRSVPEAAAASAAAAIAAAALEEDEEMDADDEEISPFAGLAAESGVPPPPPSAIAAPPGRPATQGTPPVPMTLPGSAQPYYPVLDPFGRPIPMPRPSPTPPVEQKPGAVVQ